MRTRSSRLACLGLTLAGAAACVALIAALALINVRDGLSPLELIYLQIWLTARTDDLNRPVGDDPNPIAFVVSPGDTAATIGQHLQAQGVITDAELFRNYVRYHGLDDDLEAGRYFLNTTQTIPEIARSLTDSSAASITVQIIEGWRREEIAQALDANRLLAFNGADFLAITGPGASGPSGFMEYVSLPVGASLEGFLYPDTYYLPPDAGAADFRDILLRTFQERVGPLLRNEAIASGRTLYEVVTLASIVQREAVFTEEQPLIAGVYLNRLEINMKLEADPTVQYGIGYRDGSWWPQITQDDYLTAQSPYNTYLHEGLPPGPIANPPLSAIRAVINPAPSNYYYFRADCQQSGFHVFATTFEEHVANGFCQ